MSAKPVAATTSCDMPTVCHSSSAVLLHLLCNREVAQLSLRSESHVRPQDPSSPAAEVKQTDLVAPLYTLRWAAMQNILSDLVRTDRSSMLPGSMPPRLSFPAPLWLVCSRSCARELGQQRKQSTRMFLPPLIGWYAAGQPQACALRP